MKGGTVQITWHGSDPVLSLDFHRLSGLLATGGADHDIKFWTLYEAVNAPLPSATFHSSLSYHTAAVNVVRFSAAGDQLASGADGGEILLWRLTENPEASSMWKLAKNLRFHVKDVLDLQWSSDGTLLVSGSVDNTVIIWDIVKGNPQQVLKDHMHYVQGVAWDPIGQYIASISGDRTCRIYCNKPLNPKGKSQDRHNFSCQSVLVKIEVPKQEDEASKVAAAKLNLFHDETLPSFFRRLAWSPDGSFLLVPAGIHKLPSQSDLTNTAFIISRKDLSRPAVQLPGASKPVVAVRFCPVMFTCHPNIEQNLDKDSNDTGVFKLPYRLVFAVATLNSLFVYDTQSIHPIAVLAGIHYAAITDIAWSCDGKFLAVSSQDGFCTLVAFDQEELGSPLPLSELPSYIAKFLPPANDQVGQQDRQANAYSVNSGNSGTPLQKNREANTSSGFVTQASETQIEPPRESQHALSVNTGTPSSERYQEANAASGSIPKKPRRITPVAVLCAPSLQDHQANASCVNSGNSTTPLQQNQEANASSGFVMQASATQIEPPRESQHALSVNTSTRSEQYQEANASSGSIPNKPSVANSRAQSQQDHANASGNSATPLQKNQEANASSIPNKPSVAISRAPSQQDHANASCVNSGNSATPLQQNQEANAASGFVRQASATQIELLQESQLAGCIDVTNSKDHMLSSSPKKPMCITPVAVSGAPSQQDRQANVSSVNYGNSGTPLPQNQEANASSGFVMQASATQIGPIQDVGCIDVTYSEDHILSGTDKIENLQSSPKRPRRITPVAMDVSCTTQQIADASSDDRK